MMTVAEGHSLFLSMLSSVHVQTRFFDRLTNWTLCAFILCLLFRPLYLFIVRFDSNYAFTKKLATAISN